MVREFIVTLGMFVFLVFLTFNPSAATAQNSLEIKTIPSGISVRVAGEDVGKSPTSLDVGSDQMNLSLTGEDYNWTSSLSLQGDLEMVVNLDSAQNQSPYPVKIASKPEKARLMIDGEPHGRTPWTGEISLGTHVVELKKDGHELWSARVDVRSGLVLNAPLTPKDEAGSNGSSKTDTGETRVVMPKDKADGDKSNSVKTVMEASDTGGAAATVERTSPAKDTKTDDSEPMKAEKNSKETPAREQADESDTPAKERATASKENQQDAERQALQELMRSDRSQRPETIPLTVQSDPEGATLFIDGKKIGTTPFVKKDFTSGTSTLRLTQKGHKTWEETFYLDEATQLKVKLKPQRAYLNVIPEPDEMTVKINGRSFDLNGQQTFQVDPGTYELTASAYGYDSFDTSVTLVKGSEKSLPIELKRTPKVWQFPTTRDVFLKMAREHMDELVDDFGIEATYRVSVQPEYDDWAHKLMEDAITVAMNHNGVLAVDDPVGRKSAKSLDREFKFYIVEMDVNYDSAGEKHGFKWVKRRFTLQLHATLLSHDTGEVQYTKYFEKTATDKVPLMFKDELLKPYEPPQTAPPIE